MVNCIKKAYQYKRIIPKSAGLKMKPPIQKHYAQKEERREQTTIKRWPKGSQTKAKGTPKLYKTKKNTLKERPTYLQLKSMKLDGMPQYSRKTKNPMSNTNFHPGENIF